MLKAIEIGLICLGALAGAVGIRLLRYKIWRLQDQAPLGARVVFLTLVLVVVLLLTKRITPPVLAFIVIPAGVLLAFWGWLRYRQSPFLQRRAKTSSELARYLASQDLDAVDEVMAASLQQDDAEREQLRGAALHDRRAAVEFQNRTKAELINWDRGAALFKERVAAGPGAAAGEKVFVSRRLKLEADLAWIHDVLSGSSGAA